MTATAFANDPVLDLHPLDCAPVTTSPRIATAPRFATEPRFATGPVTSEPLASEAAMDRWFGRPHLDAGIDPMVEVYRRRRFAVALALTAVLLLVSQLAGISLTSFGPISSTSDESTPVVHVVRPGDTYAGIAAELGVEHPQSFAHELQRANGFAELTVGQRLVVDLSELDTAGPDTAGPDTAGPDTAS